MRAAAGAGRGRWRSPRPGDGRARSPAGCRSQPPRPRQTRGAASAAPPRNTAANSTDVPPEARAPNRTWEIEFRKSGPSSIPAPNAAAITGTSSRIASRAPTAKWKRRRAGSGERVTRGMISGARGWLGRPARIVYHLCFPSRQELARRDGRPMAQMQNKLSGLSSAKQAVLRDLLRKKRPAEGATDRIEPREDRLAPLPLSFSQLRLWFLDRLHPGDPVYNLPSATRILGTLHLPSLALALAGRGRPP